MKTFNAFQLVIMLCIWPFLIQWLANAEFRGSTAAFYSACILYLIQLGWTVECYRNYFGD